MTLTELDLCVLAVVWREGPLTAYGVRTVFKNSTTAGWSSSSGSIYPAIKRLENGNLIAREAPADLRGTRQLTITTHGLEAIRGWMLALTPEMGSATPDPIRTRSQFLTCLPAAQRSEFVKAAREHTLSHLAILEAHEASIRDEEALILDHLGTLGSVNELRARLDWLNKVADSRAMI
jgi:DNA-binding PadR family transcriptional regulator